MGCCVFGEVVSDIWKHNSPFISLGSSSKIWLLYCEGEGTMICQSVGNRSPDDALSHPCRVESPLLHKIVLILKTVCYLPESIMIAVLWCVTALLSRCYWNLMDIYTFGERHKVILLNFLPRIMRLRMHRTVWMPQVLLLKISNCNDNSNNESKHSERSSIFSNGRPSCELFLSELYSWYAHLYGVKR